MGSPGRSRKRFAWPHSTRMAFHDLEKRLNELAQSRFKVVAITQDGSRYTLVWATH
jgi:hypothetical protein